MKQFIPKLAAESRIDEGLVNSHSTVEAVEAVEAVEEDRAG